LQCKTSHPPAHQELQPTWQLTLNPRLTSWLLEEALLAKKLGTLAPKMMNAAQHTASSRVMVKACARILVAAVTLQLGTAVVVAIHAALETVTKLLKFALNACPMEKVARRTQTVVPIIALRRVMVRVCARILMTCALSATVRAARVVISAALEIVTKTRISVLGAYQTEIRVQKINNAVEVNVSPRVTVNKFARPRSLLLHPRLYLCTTSYQ